MKLTPESALAGIPGWEHASVQVLSGGLSNHAWLVEAQGRKAVLKLDESPRGAPYNTREDEARIQSAAAEQGFANKVLFVTDIVYMTEYLEGDVWTCENLDDDANLERLARALRGLHSLPLTGREFDVLGAACAYVAKVDSTRADEAAACLQIIEAAAPPQRLCCCHNDLVAGNIIATPGIRFLDWEYACDNDPLFDLATIVAHHGLSADRRDCLLDAYFDGNGARYSARLAELECLYRALLWLWSAARR